MGRSEYSFYWFLAEFSFLAYSKHTDKRIDKVFLVSSLNHHVSILKLRVHKAYLDHLETGSLPSSPDTPDWSSPILQRSRWYDLLVPEERVELLRGLWAVAGYLTRPDALTHTSATSHETGSS
jgi:hypothetical protein